MKVVNFKPPVTVYYTTKFHCPYCVKAKELLKKHKYPIIERDIETDLDARAKFLSYGFKTVPQIYVGIEHIGGCDDLEQWLQQEEKKYDVV